MEIGQQGENKTDLPEAGVRRSEILSVLKCEKDYKVIICLFKPGFSTSALLTFFAKQVMGSCPEQCRILSINPGLHSPNAKNTPSLAETIKKVSRSYQMSPSM